MITQSVSTICGIEVQLRNILRDSVNSGASIGFIPPLLDAKADAYWLQVEKNLQAGDRELFVIEHAGQLIGCAQLSLCSKENGRHRGEVEKVMVLSEQRGKGCGKLLMNAVESAARERQLLLLVLDTRKGDVASELYRRQGYVEVGAIPDFALNSTGQIDPTVIFYKQLRQ